MPLVPQPLTPAHRLIPSPTGKHGGGNTPGFAGWGTRAWANGTSSGCTESGGRYCCGSFVLWVPISAQLGFSTLDRARGFYTGLLYGVVEATGGWLDCRMRLDRDSRATAAGFVYLLERLLTKILRASATTEIIACRKRPMGPFRELA